MIVSESEFCEFKSHESNLTESTVSRPNPVTAVMQHLGETNERNDSRKREGRRKYDECRTLSCKARSSSDERISKYRCYAQRLRRQNALLDFDSFNCQIHKGRGALRTPPRT